MHPVPVLAITAGEPAGIGPDLCLQLAQQEQGQALVVLADKALLQQRAVLLGLDVRLHDYDAQQIFPLPAGHLRVLHVPLVQAVQAGKLNPANSYYVLDLLRRAVQGCQSGEFGSIVTAPVHKGIINDAGIPFTGHTEFLAEQTGMANVPPLINETRYARFPLPIPLPRIPSPQSSPASGRGSEREKQSLIPAGEGGKVSLREVHDKHTGQVVMMLAGGGMRVALATTHLALRAVPDAITAELLESVLRIIQRDLVRRFGIAHPRILVAGLNPHAGEGGYLGREEIEVMIPVLDKLRTEGINVSAPLPADTLFTPQRLAQCDCVLAMYHDQGLPVLKHASFGHGVNVTLGMPIIRTSVDHGTALELAGTGRADVGSLLEAIKMAADMARNEQAATAINLMN